MNVLFFGSDRLLSRVRSQTQGQSWELTEVSGPEEVEDLKGTHEFHAAVIGVCPNNKQALQSIKASKHALKVPVVIALTPMKHASEFARCLPEGADVVLADCSDDRFLKSQCDALVRLANEVAAEDIVSNDVTFHTSRDAFSVRGQYVRFPRKQHKLLELLFLKSGRTVTTDMVLNHLYGWEEPPNSKIVDVFVCQIRRRLREAGSQECCIQTVWGQGYRVIPKWQYQQDKAA